MYPKTTRLPDYYDQKVFIYDFTRCWFKAVTLKDDGDYDHMEPFMEHTKWNSPIDAEMGPDGRLYVLEYGSGWFSRNPDAGISRIDFNPGNRSPRITDIQVNKTSGSLPLRLSASIEAKDPENDALTYVWHIGKTLRRTTTTPELSYTLSAAGDYPVSVEVRDGKSKPAVSNTVGVYAGNEAPTVGISLKGNKSFYFPETPVAYSVTAKDKEDKTIVRNNLIVTADYMEGTDKAAAPQGHQVLSSAATGRNIMMSLDCKTCHKPNEKSIGPAFRDVAIRYQKDPNMVPSLTQKIKKGGSGKWGEVVMPAHPDLKDEDIRLILGYLQSLAAPKIKPLPATGALKPTLDKPEKEKGVLTITATYTDKGGPGIKPLTATEALSLHNPKITFGRRGGERIVSTDSVDLTDVRSVALFFTPGKDTTGSRRLEFHLDTESGATIGHIDLGPDDRSSATLSAALDPVTDGQPHRLVITRSPDAANIRIHWIVLKDK